MVNHASWRHLSLAFFFQHQQLVQLNCFRLQLLSQPIFLPVVNNLGLVQRLGGTALKIFVLLAQAFMHIQQLVIQADVSRLQLIHNFNFLQQSLFVFHFASPSCRCKLVCALFELISHAFQKDYFLSLLPQVSPQASCILNHYFSSVD